MTKLRIENLRKTFGGTVAVDDVNLQLEQGNFRTLLGPSGCGKTTLLRCVAGLEQPDAGQIWIDNECIEDVTAGVHVPTRRREIGMVFQSYAVWPHMTVAENVEYPLKKRQIGSKQERNARVAELLETVGLEENRDNLAVNLSGGQQQRVAIARALAPEPALLLFDEPLSNLDAKLRRQMRREIKRIQTEFDVTILYVTHAQEEAMYLSDAVSLVRKGRIVEEGPPSELYTDPQTFFGMTFMGNCNVLTGEVTAVSADGLGTVSTTVGTFEAAHVMGELTEGDRAYVCFRPKHCRPTDGDAVFRGTITSGAFTQDFTEYVVAVDGTDLLMRTPDPTLNEGEAVGVTVDPADVRLYSVAVAETVDRGDQPVVIAGTE